MNSGPTHSQNSLVFQKVYVTLIFPPCRVSIIAISDIINPSVALLKLGISNRHPSILRDRSLVTGRGWGYKTVGGGKSGFIFPEKKGAGRFTHAEGEEGAPN